MLKVVVNNYRLRISKGLCGRCGRKGEENFAVCFACRTKLKFQRQARIVKDTCTKCTKQLKSKTLCDDHLKEIRIKYELRKTVRLSQGLCGHCGRQKVSRLTTCLVCRKKSKARRQNLMAKSICIRCSKNRVVTGVSCISCLEESRLRYKTRCQS